MKSVATARGDVNAQPLAMDVSRNSCYSSNSAMESTPTPAEMAAGPARRTILSISLGFEDRPTSGSQGQMHRCDGVIAGPYFSATGVSYCGISSGETCLRMERHPALRWPESVRRRLCGTWEPGERCERRNPSGGPMRMSVRKRCTGTESPAVAMKSSRKGRSEGLCQENA